MQKIMGKSEMDTYINKIGRTELFDELKDIHNSAYGLIRGIYTLSQIPKSN